MGFSGSIIQFEMVQSPKIEELLKDLETFCLGRPPVDEDAFLAALAGKLQMIFAKHPRGGELARGIRRFELDPVATYYDGSSSTRLNDIIQNLVGDAYEARLNPTDPIDYESLYKIADQQLVDQFRSEVRRYLCDCIQIFNSNAKFEVPAFIPKKQDLGFVEDPEFRNTLHSLWNEAYLARQYGMAASGCILVASFIEGILCSLWAAILSEQEKTKFGSAKGFDGKPTTMPVEKWGLEQHLYVADQKKLVEDAHLRLLKLIQAQRNYVHPGKQLRKPLTLETVDLDAAFASTQKLLQGIRKFLAIPRA